MSKLAPTLSALALLFVASAHAADISYAEDFALAKDRTEALKKLIPGTEDYYYYHCLHYLNTNQFDKAVALFKPWYDRTNQSARLTEIQTRHALLNYEKNPTESLRYFRDRLGLTFDHQKIVQGGAPNLPTALDPKMISRETLAANAWNRWRQGTDIYEDAAIDWALTDQTDGGLRRHFLGRLTRPDIANLPMIVADDLNTIHSGGFGSFGIHRQMTLKQMDDLLKLIPDLINNGNFVQAWIAKLHPGEDEDWRRDPKLTKAYLERLLTFSRKLAPAFNPLKAHITFHRLILDETMGQMDKALFVEYLKLPRQQAYMSKVLLESVVARDFPASLGANYQPWTMLNNVPADETVVRSYLKHFLLNGATVKEFEPYINDTYLKHLNAEVKIENGIGEPEDWAANLPPELFRQLKDRIDIDFAATSKTSFGVDEPVKLEMFIKNVPTLMVKVFEINTTNFYRTQKREIDTAINLDGLVANSEQTITYTEAPFRRMPRKFDFPQLTKPGVYVVDFIGNGKSSRALIRKGRLRTLQTMSTVGHKLTIIDETDKPVQGATVLLGTQEYKSDGKGNVLLPFSTTPSRQPIIISKGEFSSIDFLQHQAENYSLTAGIHVDRESLLTQRVTSLLVRPQVKVNGIPASVKLLEDVRLVITAVDQDGIASNTEVPNFKLFEDRESVHDFRVPPRMASLSVTLVAKAKCLSTGKEVTLSSRQTFGVNGIDRTDKIEDLHLAKFGDDYVVELLGRTGEAKPDRPVQIVIKHREFKETVNVLLKSDAQGRVKLGPLANITSVTVTGPEATAHTWNLPVNRHTFRQVIHAQQGEPIAVPYIGTSPKPLRSELALFEIRGPSIYADRFESIAIKDGTLEITGLAAGDYELLMKETNERVRLRVVDGSVQSGYVLGKLRHLQLPALKPVQIASLTSDDEFVRIRLRDFSEFTRLHVYGTRYMPAYSSYGNLTRVRDVELAGAFPISAESIYLAGRNIGDEYRYVLDRRNQKPFPGNMLERPSLLLNPWVIRSTETGEQLAQAGEEYRKILRESGGGSIPAPATPPPENSNAPGASDFSGLDFLYESSAALLNLVPDKDGVIKIKRSLLTGHSMIQVLAVDPVNTTARTLNLPEVKTNFVDLRLKNGLDPQRHFTQQKQVNVLNPGQPFVIEDALASRFEVYDSLAKVYGLYSTLSHDPKLAEFSFILNWPKMKPEEKKAIYSKYACHELSFFIAKKDPEFFKAVIVPYLANKKDKTFMDQWLLEADLGDFGKPWQHARLNSAEKVLFGQRTKDGNSKASRFLVDLNRLSPPNLERSRMLFESALKAGDLNLGDGTSNDIALMIKEKLDAERPTQTFPPGGAMPAAPPGLAGPNGGMGMGGAKRDEMTKDMKEMPQRSGAPKGKKGGEAKGDRGDGKPNEEMADKLMDAETEFFGDDRKQLGIPSRLYRKVDPTQELAENNYYKLPIQQQIASLVPVSDFWIDYANYDGKGPFLSRNLADASRNFTEMMLALSVIDLPFTPGKHDVKFESGKMTFVPGNTALAFHEEVKPVAAAGNSVQILVSQNFYRHGDRYRDENGERFDKFVTDEFVVHTVYGCQVVVTNPTPSRQRLSVLTQIPVGSLPVANGQATKSVPLDLEPYRTHIIDFQFYFPRSGKFQVFPVHIAKAESLVASAGAFTFNVVDKPTKLDTQSWDYVSQNGSADEVFAMMNRENILALDLNKIAFRMRDKDFFEATLALLEKRHTFNPTLWSYGIHHNVTSVAKEYLTQVDQIVNECGGPISTPLLVVNPIVRHQYEHLEYKPIINARAHSLGHNRQIVNDRFHHQYESFMKTLTYRPKLTDDDLMTVCYYQLLQDRVAEAIDAWKQIKPENLAMRMQYDYCAAYLEMFADERKKSRAIVAKYADHPVERWRNAFVAIGKQLDEIEGKAPKIVDKDDQAQQQAELAAKESTFEFGVAAKTINLTWKNVDTVRINYYLMDVELLFSRNPFVSQTGSGQFSLIKPNETALVKLPGFQNKLAIPLPENLSQKNVLVEITANGKTRSVPVLANVMAVTMNENYGQLQVTDSVSGAALSKVYVKTYVRLANGTVKFHKDGYTDLRGKFDYASVSTPEKSAIAKFGILVLSDTQGALIREASPPQQ